MPGKRFTHEAKFALYEQYKKTNLGKSAFAENCGVSKSAFARWVCEFDNEQHIQEQAFGELLKPIISSKNELETKPACEINNIDHIEFIMPNNVIIKLPITNDLHLLAEILALIVA